MLRAPKQRRCENCDELFIPRKKKQRFCKPSCRVLNYQYGHPRMVVDDEEFVDAMLKWLKVAKVEHPLFAAIRKVVYSRVQPAKRSLAAK